MRKSIAQFVSFSKKETIAVVVLIGLVVPFALLPALSRQSEEEQKKGDAQWISVAESLDNEPTSAPERSYARSSGYQYSNRKNSYERTHTGRLFNFDPNTASAAQLQELGLRDKTISILSNYRSKGGKFRRAEDLQKIYGLKPEEFQRLRPYIVIADQSAEYKTFEKSSPISQPEVQTRHEQKRKVVAIDVNTADTTAFQSLYGIGSKLAARIVNFRSKLGGFYSIDQVGETYGVPEETFQNIKQYLQVDASGVRKMDVNNASYDELNAHPYISSKLAYLIMKYRKENGRVETIDNLKELVAQTNDSFEKVINYTSF